MISSAVAHAVSLPGESIQTNQLKIHITGAKKSLTQLIDRIWEKIGEKKKTPGIQESLSLVSFRLSSGDLHQAASRS